MKHFYQTFSYHQLMEELVFGKKHFIYCKPLRETNKTIIMVFNAKK